MRRYQLKTDRSIEEIPNVRSELKKLGTRSQYLSSNSGFSESEDSGLYPKATKKKKFKKVGASQRSVKIRQPSDNHSSLYATPKSGRSAMTHKSGRSIKSKSQYSPQLKTKSIILSKPSAQKSESNSVRESSSEVDKIDFHPQSVKSFDLDKREETFGGDDKATIYNN